MKASKAFCCLALAVSVACAGAGFAQAEDHPAAAETVHMGVFDNNPIYRSLTPEKQAVYNSIVKSTEETMLPLREQMMAKRIQLETMASMPNMDHEAIAKVAAEIAAIHTQMIKVHNVMADRFAKELGISLQRGTCWDGNTYCPMHQEQRGRGHHQSMMGLLPIMPAF